MFRGDLTFLRILRFVVLLLPLMAAVAMGQPRFWPWGLLSLIASLVIALAPFFRTSREPWLTLTLALEVVLGIFVGLRVSGIGVFAAFVIASDIGFSSRPTGILAAVDVLLGIVATSSAVGHPSLTLDRQLVEDLPLGLVFVLAMWGNTQGTRQMMALTKAYRALKRARAQEQELIKLRERERIAQNLHDVLGHSLTLIVLKAELISEHLKRRQWDKGGQETNSLLMVARRSLDEVRGVVESLPAYSTLREMVAELDKAQIETELDWRPPQASGPALLADWDLMVREGITNILRHASATRAAIKLEPEGAGWQLVVADNGHGMNQPKGHGLCGIERRAARWNGTMSIVSGPEKGTRICVKGEFQAVVKDGGEDGNDPDYCY
ncbi:MAG: histidine kinase [Firmicutes bacterium]|uniref:histidine kinase n=1 Tax=Sulfobacillus benefaciens TaxID=453960 RepID=A0A2T2X0U8_9FIRM|nr:histidine kinase [Bacillota bacterium]PSR28120.1 MAG: hypothetical protein C7B43_10355 [Sulfobacillus benefaciens]